MRQAVGFTSTSVILRITRKKLGVAHIPLWQSTEHKVNHNPLMEPGLKLGSQASSQFPIGGVVGMNAEAES